MFLEAPAWSRIRRAAGVAVALALSIIVIAGCGSSSSSTSNTTVAAANVSSSSGASGGVAAAQQVVAQAMQRPSTITVSQPIGKAVPSGKKVVFISCGVSVCQVQGQIVAGAAKKLGWTVEIVNTNGTPTSVQSAYDTAVRDGANAIVTTAALRAEIAAKIPELQSKGIVVSNCCSTDPVSPPFIYNTDTPAQDGPIGKYLAAEVVADSKGKASTLYVNIPAFTILSTLSSEFQQTYKQYCPSCGYGSIDVSLTQLAHAPNLIVSYLRSHPSVKYVALSDVKIVGQGGGPTDFQYLASGQELALVPFDYYNVDWQMVDALARHFAGASVQLTPPPVWLVTKSNLPSNHSNLFPDVTAYQSQFLKLWGKS